MRTRRGVEAEQVHLLHSCFPREGGENYCWMSEFLNMKIHISQIIVVFGFGTSIKLQLNFWAVLPDFLLNSLNTHISKGLGIFGNFLLFAKS